MLGSLTYLLLPKSQQFIKYYTDRLKCLSSIFYENDVLYYNIIFLHCSVCNNVLYHNIHNSYLQENSDLIAYIFFISV